VRIVNPNDDDVPMYWWSNMAVRQTARTRVLAPAADAWNYSYDQVLRRVPVASPADEFGTGVFQTSTSMLAGRKLFRWGSGPGGQRWQEWLCGPGDGYAEIQAGIATTQFEHLRMPGGADWSWVEAYGRLDLAPEAAHGSWQQATDTAAATIAARF